MTIAHVRDHPLPVWGHIADSVIYAHAEGEGFPVEFFEELPSRKLEENRHEICAVPLFARNLALGDIVSVSHDESGRLILAAVVERSGRFDYRVWLGDLPDSEKGSMHRHIVEVLSGFGCPLEHYSENLMGIDAPDESVAQRVVDFLLEHQSSGIAVEAANQ